MFVKLLINVSTSAKVGQNNVGLTPYLNPSKCATVCFLYFCLQCPGSTSIRGRDKRKTATFTSHLSWDSLDIRMHHLWMCRSQQLNRVQNIQTVFVPSSPFYVWTIHLSLHRRSRLQWIRCLCLDIWYLLGWLPLFIKNVHIWKGTSKELCQSMGVRSIFNVAAKHVWSANIG